MALCDAEGNVFDHPELELAGWDGECWRPVEVDEVVRLPEGSDLFMLPGRRPAGFDREQDEMVVVDEDGVFGASCFLAPAYLRTLLPAYETLEGAPALPLFAYSAVGVLDGELVAPAIRVDADVRQDPFRFDIGEVERGVESRLSEQPNNRVIKHLTRCALEYHCRAAQNFFLGRFEAPLPAASTCNAVCVGCISLQPEGGDDQTVAAHSRIPFTPTPREIADLALSHVERVGEDAVVSFGQGCEGEPLLQAEVLEASIRRFREGTSRGTVNLNSNASRPDAVERLCDAGLESLRISTNSARAPVYSSYYRPSRYTFADVRESGRVVKAHDGYLMLNYFVFPGVTDTAAELEALSAWIEEDGVDMIQLRNLNIDPETYLETVDSVGGLGEPMGIIPWLRELNARFPELRFGYFNPPRGTFSDPPDCLPITPMGALDAHL
ncbi:MAG: radical SAM protein [Deltaproteobacteria bacterium]|nr:radical SAM protein [Deltaproteobacteria bacterium]